MLWIGSRDAVDLAGRRRAINSHSAGFSEGMGCSTSANEWAWESSKGYSQYFECITKIGNRSKTKIAINNYTEIKIRFNTKDFNDINFSTSFSKYFFSLCIEIFIN